MSGIGISWAICKSAPRSRQITTPAPHHSVFYRPDALPAAQPTASKHWRQNHRQKRLLCINSVTAISLPMAFVDISVEGWYLCVLLISMQVTRELHTTPLPCPPWSEWNLAVSFAYGHRQVAYYWLYVNNAQICVITTSTCVRCS